MSSPPSMALPRRPARRSRSWTGSMPPSMKGSPAPRCRRRSIGSAPNPDPTVRGNSRASSPAKKTNGPPWPRPRIFGSTEPKLIENTYRNDTGVDVMAKIVFAAGTSHTPMLLANDETLPRFVETDQKIKHRDKEGRPVTYGDLLEKADPKMAHMVAPAHLVARQNVARAAMARLRQTLAATNLDALTGMGDDQDESYQ